SHPEPGTAAEAGRGSPDGGSSPGRGLSGPGGGWGHPAFFVQPLQHPAKLGHEPHPAGHRSPHDPAPRGGSRASTRR
ncbi:hypothetical protein ABTK78_20355, partial [Acinetobacter baumannii]